MIRASVGTSGERRHVRDLEALEDAAVERRLRHEGAEQEAVCYLPPKRAGWSFLPASCTLPSCKLGLSHDLRPHPDNALWMLP